jgi:hypothetical protein
MPLIQKGAKAVGETALSAGMNVARDVMACDELGKSARSQLRAAASQLKRDTLNQISQTGSGK